MVHAHTPETYYVATKAFVRRGEELLVLLDRSGKEWDLPGGRIGVGEFDVGLEEVLRRELGEELGSDFRYRSHGPVALFRHRRAEVTAEHKPEIRILMIGFELEYLGGAIALSEEHSAWEWVSLAHARDRLSGGQKDGLTKYLAYLGDSQQRIQY